MYTSPEIIHRDFALYIYVTKVLFAQHIIAEGCFVLVHKYTLRQDLTTKLSTKASLF